MKRLKRSVLAILLVMSLFELSSCDVSSILTTTQYGTPSWAPSYSSGVRYYYLPDIETYYDCSDQNFVYLQNGQWMFSYSLPAMYSNYDLFTGYVVVLNINTYQPWLYHQNYTSHYPRYYYQQMYRQNDWRNIRGFNENDRQPVMWRNEDRDRVNDLRKNFNYFERKQEPVRQPQNPVFRGKDVGQPVRVTPKMREPRNNNPKEKKWTELLKN